ncbi:MAG: thermosome subunit alpha [Euryarchaeota archaeon]|nr:thermosome subunit alpha [Euryarchaeota archaeon]
MAGLSGQPILILREGARREKGKEALENNIMAARAVAEAVRSTLGPRGMDKLMVDSLGDVTITNDGVTILQEMDVQHPAAKMVVEAAKTQNDEVGDGTTTTAVIVGELLKKAEELIEMDVHPTVIVSGYRLASDRAIEVLESLAFDVSKNDQDLLEKIALTAMTGKFSGTLSTKLAEYVVKMVLFTAEETDGKTVVDLKKIIVEKKPGESMEESELVEGLIIDKDRVHTNMPKKTEQAKIALINAALEAKDPETKAEITITSSDQFKMFADREKARIREVADKVIASGANVVFCQKGIEDIAQHHLAKAGVMALRRVKRTDMKRLAKATGANIVTNLDEMTPEDLGDAGLVEDRKVGGGHLTFVTGVAKGTVSLLLRGGTEQVVNNLQIALDDALHAVAAAIEDQKMVAGGGATEVELSLRLKEYAATLVGREQLATDRFADALDEIPKSLAENAGLNSIDKLVAIKSRHEAGEKTSGLDVYTGEVVDMREMGVIEPLRVKVQAIRSATDAAALILRIDDVIASKRTEMPPGGGMPGAGMGGGMGGMPPGMPPGMM